MQGSKVLFIEQNWGFKKAVRLFNEPGLFFKN